MRAASQDARADIAANFGPFITLLARAPSQQARELGLGQRGRLTRAPSTRTLARWAARRFTAYLSWSGSWPPYPDKSRVSAPGSYASLVSRHEARIRQISGARTAAGSYRT